MVNYKNSKIYTIRSHHTDKIYIGSTCNALRKRLYDHKSAYKSYLNNIGGNCSSYDIIKYNDAYIELYEYYPCNNKVELHKREGELIRELDCVNKYIPGRNVKEYRKEYMKEYMKEYYDYNKNNILEKRKKYYENNKNKISKIRNAKFDCNCGGKYTHTQKARHNKSIKHRTYIFNLHNELNHL